MKNLQKMGGVAALYEAASYIIAMVGYLVVLDTLDDVDPVQQVVSLVENQAVYYILNLIAYVFWGFAMVVLTLALYQRLKSGSPIGADSDRCRAYLGYCDHCKRYDLKLRHGHCRRSL